MSSQRNWREVSIVIPLEQGLRLWTPNVTEYVGVHSIVIPLEQGLRLYNSHTGDIISEHSIVIPLEQGLSHVGDILKVP